MTCTPTQICSGYKISRMGWRGHVARMEVRRGVDRNSVGQREGKRQIGRPKFRWENNITMYLQEVGWGLWSGSSWVRVGTDGGLLCMR